MESDAPPPPPPPTTSKDTIEVKNQDEPVDTPDQLDKKVKKLAEYIKKSSHLVVYTGAGISTSAEIPDYRGTGGILDHGIFRFRELDLDFVNPTLSHLALVGLQNQGKLKCVVTSNHDNLHFKSGITSDKLAELHGNNYIEYCTKCNNVYRRTRAVPNLGAHLTGRTCEQPNCDGQLKDNGIDFNQPLPQRELDLATKHSKKADISLVLGSSMTVSPFCELPPKAKKMIICNLKTTPKDKKAKMIIRAKTDDVMKKLMSELGIPIPDFILKEYFVVSFFDSIITVKGQSVYEPPYFIEKVELVGEREAEEEEDQTFHIKNVTVASPLINVHFKECYKEKPLEIQVTEKRIVCTFSKTFKAGDPPIIPPMKQKTGNFLDAIKNFPGKEYLAKKQ